MLGGGCFWCLDAVFRDLEGVLEVESGYAGGAGANPSYEAVCSGRTGHAEVVKVTFDPAKLAVSRPAARVLHDPRPDDAQPAGQRRRHAIPLGDLRAVRRAARDRASASCKEIEDAKLYPGKIVTELAGAAPYYPAERYHQDYFENNPGQPYCMFVVAPKVVEVPQAVCGPAEEGARA